METLKFPLLTADQIEVKVKKVTSAGAVLLLYKTARTDMQLLDQAGGPLNWESDYKEIKGNLYAGIGIYSRDADAWIWKWDCGTESRQDDEGNEKKGEASDAFKRAGFKWGIGRELYTAPFTFAHVEVAKNDRGKYDLKDRFLSFRVSEIGYDENGCINRLRILSNKGAEVFAMGGQKKPAAAQAAQEDVTCERCGKAITDAVGTRGPLSAEQVLRLSRKFFDGAQR